MSKDGPQWSKHATDYLKSFGQPAETVPLPPVTQTMLLELNGHERKITVDSPNAGDTQFFIRGVRKKNSVGSYTQLVRSQWLENRVMIDEHPLKEDEIAIIEVMSKNGSVEFISKATDQHFSLSVIPNIEHPAQTVLLFPKKDGPRDRTDSFLTQLKDVQTNTPIIASGNTEPNTKYFAQNNSFVISPAPPGIDRNHYDSKTIEQFFQMALSSDTPVDATTIAAVYTLQIQLSRHKRQLHTHNIKESLKNNMSAEWRSALYTKFQVTRFQAGSQTPKQSFEQYIDACLTKQLEEFIPKIVSREEDVAPLNVSIPDSFLGVLQSNPWFCIKKDGEGRDIVEVKDHEALMCVVDIDGDEVYLTLNIEPAAALLNTNTVLLPGGGKKEGEDPIDAACRELGEEQHKTISSNPEDTIHLGKIKATDKVQGHSHVVLARNVKSLEDQELANAKSRADEQHAVKTLRLPLNQVEQMILQGYITDARTIAAVGLAKFKMEQLGWLPTSYTDTMFDLHRDTEHATQKLKQEQTWPKPVQMPFLSPPRPMY